MSSCIYSVGGTTSTPDMISSSLTLSTTILAGQSVEIEDIGLMGHTATSGSITCNVAIGGVQKASYTETLASSGDKFFFVRFNSGGALPGPLVASGGEALAISFSLTTATLLGASPASQPIAGFASNPNVVAATSAMGEYVRVNRANKVVGNWALSSGTTWPVAAITHVRTETATPTFFVTIPTSGSRWEFTSTVTTTKLASQEANGAFYYPPIRMPSTLVAGEGVEFGVAVDSDFTITLNSNTLMFEADTTVIQPRIQVDIDNAGGVFITGDALQAYQDFEGFPLQNLLNPSQRFPSQGRTTVDPDTNFTFFMQRTAGASSSWSYDPYFGTCLTFGSPNRLRLYNMLEGGKWGWNFGPAATYALLDTLGTSIITGSKDEGYLGWPSVIADDIFSTKSIDNAVGTGGSTFAMSAPLSISHRAVECIGWGTGVIGTTARFNPVATSIPYSCLGKVTVGEYNGVTSWTATNATNCAPVFLLGNSTAETEGNGVLLVPHYIDRAAVYTYTTGPSYNQLTDSEVLAGGVNVSTNTVTVAPANLLTGANISNLVQGATWATQLATLVSHPNVQTVATSSLHVAEIALASAKEVIIMKFGDLVLGAGGKFKDFIETYTDEAAFTYAEPKTFVVDPSELAGMSLPNFQGRTTYTASFAEQDVLRAAYGTPYQGFVGYTRYTPS